MKTNHGSYFVTTYRKNETTCRLEKEKEKERKKKKTRYKEEKEKYSC